MITGPQAKKIIKDLGYDISKVSCTIRRGTYSLTVSVKDISIPLEPIKAALSKFEKINRCDYTGEILQGENHFVFVEYDWKTPVTEAFVDLYTLSLTRWGQAPKDHTECYHFRNTMKEDAPWFAYSQVSFAFNHIYRTN